MRAAISRSYAVIATIRGCLLTEENKYGCQCTSY